MTRDAAPGAADPRERDPFPSTLWSVIRRAGSAGDPATLEADWRRIVEAYRSPILATFRRLAASRFPGLDVDDAAAEFFGYLFEHRVLARADSRQGRFRQFIQGVAWRFLHGRARRRGGRRTEPVDDSIAAPDRDPALDAEDEREWMLAMIRDALHLYAVRHPDQALVFARSHGLPLVGESDAEARRLDVAELATALRRRPNSIHAARSRAMRHIRSVVRRRIGDVATDRDDYDAEVRLLERRADEARPGIFDESRSA